MTPDHCADRYLDLLAAVIRRAQLDALGRSVCNDDGHSIYRRREAATFLDWARDELAPIADVEQAREIVQMRY